jgi:plasmid rolling circle replication initiator protein Rep
MTKNQGKNVFKDISKAGKDRKWQERKLQNIQLASRLETLGYKAFQSAFQCAEVLKFQKQKEGYLKLYQAWFCKNKLCPICNWRRAMKYSAQAKEIIDVAIQREPKGRFYF